MENKTNLFILLFSIITIPLMAQFRVSQLFQDHAVLQRDQSIKIWGWGTAGETVICTFNQKKIRGQTDKNGKWEIVIGKHSAGGPHTITLSSGKETINIKDIYFGDVWLCSGQSNMEWLLKNSNNATIEIGRANDSMIRHCKVQRTGTYTPMTDLPPTTWAINNPENAGDFTAVGYFFAKGIREHHDVPIGLLNSSWGGSKIEAWMRAATFGEDPDSMANKLESNLITVNKNIKAQLLEKLGPLDKTDDGQNGAEYPWAASDLDIEQWDTIAVPGKWRTIGLGDLDGIMWYKKTVELTATQAASGAELNLGMIDDGDIAWINGYRVGATNSYNAHRKYKVSADILKPGSNQITVRVMDSGSGGGFHGASDQVYLAIGSDKITLAGDWRYRVSAMFPVGSSSTNKTPTLLYNAMIHPLIDFPIKGVIWYQGESNARVTSAYKYREFFSTMIRDWRNIWGIEDFPFFFVQLANFMAPPMEPVPSNWAMLRESQTVILDSLSNTAQAVIIDIGEAKDIHPRNKQDVGYRLALAARKMVYGEALFHASPRYTSMAVEGHTIRLRLKDIGSGLMVKDKYGYLKSFTIAGVDRQFRWAQAKLEGNEVIVWHPDIDQPVAVRFGWADNPDDLNLFSKEGLPVTPFRTDDWEQ